MNQLRARTPCGSLTYKGAIDRFAFATAINEWRHQCHSVRKSASTLQSFARTAFLFWLPAHRSAVATDAIVVMAANTRVSDNNQPLLARKERTPLIVRGKIK